MLSVTRCLAASVGTMEIMDGLTHYRHGNGGVTVEGIYHPPSPPETPESNWNHNFEMRFHL